LRKLINGLFCFACFAALMAGIQASYAEDKPLAVCKDGKCTMSEEDFKRLQEFIRRVEAVIAHNNEAESAVNQQLEAYAGAVARCQADRHRHTKD